MTTLTPAPPAPSARTRPLTSRARRAAVYVVGLLWALPLLAFTVAALVADSTPCTAVDGLPCDAEGMVVTTSVLLGVLLIPVGLLALLAVPLLTTQARRPIVVAAVASALGLAAGGVVVGVGYLLLSA